MNHTLREITEKTILLEYFDKNRALHVYPIGDLDDSVWQFTRWCGLFDVADPTPKAVLLLYHAFTPPVLYAIGQPDDHDLAELLSLSMSQIHTDELYCHLTPGL